MSFVILLNVRVGSEGSVQKCFIVLCIDRVRFIGMLGERSDS